MDEFLKNMAEKKIVRLAYSKGGETIHRGYYNVIGAFC